MIIRDIENRSLIVAPAPHIHSGDSFSAMMYTYVIALLPVVVFSIMTYGFHSARVIALAVSGAMAFEMLVQKMFNRPLTAYNGSAMVIGLVFALLLPPGVPWWLVLTGALVSVLIGKEIFGGSGANPFNPALVGWAALRISWNEYMNFDYTMINYRVNFPIDYPLTLLKKAGASGIQDLKCIDLFLGNQTGGLGATMGLLILIGGIILIVRGIISWKIPVFFIIGIVLASGTFWLVDSTTYASPLFHIVTGNVMLGAFFLSTEFSSSPVNTVPMIIFGLLCGVLTILFRVWSVYPDGVIFAILIMNIFNPLLDKIRPRVSGKPKEAMA